MTREDVKAIIVDALDRSDAMHWRGRGTAITSPPT
jgi:hypothetical protein